MSDGDPGRSASLHSRARSLAHSPHPAWPNGCRRSNGQRHAKSTRQSVTASNSYERGARVKRRTDGHGAEQRPWNGRYTALCQGSATVEVELIEQHLSSASRTLAPAAVTFSSAKRSDSSGQVGFRHKLPCQPAAAAAARCSPALPARFAGVWRGLALALALLGPAGCRMTRIIFPHAPDCPASGAPVS